MSTLYCQLFSKKHKKPRQSSITCPVGVSSIFILSLFYLVFFALFTSHVIYLRKDFRVGENSLYKFQAYPSIGYYIYAFLAVAIIICWSIYIFQIIKKRFSQPTKSQRIAELEKQVSELKKTDKKD